MDDENLASAIAYLDWYFEFDEGTADMQAIKSWGVVKELIKIMRDRLCDDGK